MLKETEKFCKFFINRTFFFGGSVVEWLKTRDCDQHGVGSKPTRAILLRPWEKNFTALYPVWWSWQAVLNFSHVSIKLKNQNNKFQTHNDIFGSRSG